MTVPNRNARRRIELEIDNEFLRKNLQTTDCMIVLALLSTIDLAEPEAMSLIEDIVELRAGRASEHELQTWAERARAYLRRLIGDGPDPKRLVN